MYQQKKTTYPFTRFLFILPTSTQINVILKFTRKMVHFLQIIFGMENEGEGIHTHTQCGEGQCLPFPYRQLGWGGKG